MTSKRSLGQLPAAKHTPPPKRTKQHNKSERTDITPSLFCSYGAEKDEETEVVKLNTRNVQLQEQIVSLQNELAMVKQDADFEVDFWRSEYRNANQQRMALMRNRDSLLEKFRALKYDCKITPDDLAEKLSLRDDIISEQQLCGAMENLKHVTSTKPDDKTLGLVSDLMQGILYRLEDVRDYTECKTDVDLQALSSTHPLRLLVEQAFGASAATSDDTMLPQRWSNQSVELLALCGAALARWVFCETQEDIFLDRFQNADTKTSTNRYKTAMTLVRCSDPQLALVVDHEVHRNLCEETAFKKFRDFKAKKLAIRLQEALALICEFEYPPHEESELHDNLDVDDWIVSQLSQVFSSAIEVQVLLIQTGWRYEYTWPDPGSAFERDCMQTYTGDEKRASDLGKVRLTVLPGISHLPDSRMAVNFEGFAERRHKYRGRCVQPAIVLRDGSSLE